MGIAITRAATRAGRRRVAVLVRLVLLLDSYRFALLVDGSKLSLFRLAVDCRNLDAGGFRSAIESAARAALGVEVRYLALLGFQAKRKSAELVVAVRSSEDVRLCAMFPGVVLQELETIRTLDRFDGEFDHLESAHRWAVLTDSTSRLDQSVQDIFARSISHLDLAFCIDDEGHEGWDQYQDCAGVGVLSTAQGLLCHVYAARGSDVVHRAAETLEALQNADGGWPIRRALLQGPSSVSVTESTCACLWALHEAGRTMDDPAIERGVAWLERTQYSGGWRSADFGSVPHVNATSAAVHVLAMLGCRKAVAAGINWLRHAQCSDGGWAREALGPAAVGGRSRPAYTAHALISLLAAGVPGEDRVISNGTAYLEGSFDPSAEEPWESTSYNYVVDPESSARLLFRIFTIPWALAALIRSGRDVADARILLGIERLLTLQEPSGAWRADVAPDGLYPVWAAHDALFALRTFVDAANRAPSAHFLAARRGAELQRFEESLVFALGRAHRARFRQLVRAVAMTAFGVVMAGLTLVHLGVVNVAQSFAWLQEPLAAVVLAAMSIGGVVVPAVIIEEYKARRHLR